VALDQPGVAASSLLVKVIVPPHHRRCGDAPLAIWKRGLGRAELPHGSIARFRLSLWYTRVCR
jgi:hypothetical protein